MLIKILVGIYFFVTALIIIPLGFRVDRGETGPVGLGLIILVLWGPIVLYLLHLHS